MCVGRHTEGGSRGGGLRTAARGMATVTRLECRLISDTSKVMLFLNEWQPNDTGQVCLALPEFWRAVMAESEWNGVEQMHWHDSKALTHVRDVTRFGLCSAPVHWVDLGSPSQCWQLPAMTELPPALATAHRDRQEWKYGYVHACLGPQICHRLRTAAEAHRPSPGIKCAADEAVRESEAKGLKARCISMSSSDLHGTRGSHTDMTAWRPLALHRLALQTSSLCLGCGRAAHSPPSRHNHLLLCTPRGPCAYPTGWLTG